MFNFRIKVFYFVAFHASFTKAAEELLISQPAVTKNIKELETELGVQLFIRTGNSIKLSEAGEIVMQYATDIFDLEKDLQFKLGKLKNKYAGQLSLGASTTIGQYILPVILAKFKQKHPHIELSLINDNTRKIEVALADNEIELGIVEGCSKNRQLKYEPFMKDEIVAIVHTNQPLSSKDEITIEELKSIPLVLREIGSGTLDVIQSSLKKCNIKMNDLNVVIHLGSTESIKSFLKNSNSIGLVSVSAISKEIVNGEFKIIDIKDFEILRTFYFVYPHGKLSGLADMFMHFTLNSYNQKL